MKSKIPASLIFFLPLAAVAALEQKAPPTRSPDADRALLVWDVAPELRHGLPRNFRIASDPLKLKGATSPDTTGLASLRESGSAEFTAAALAKMLPKFSGPVTVFDLRQEDHGFINGEPISWYATNNWANVGRSHDAIVADETARIRAFVPGTALALNDDRAIKGNGDATPPEKVSVAQARTEEQLVTGAGAAYVRITVSDHARPTDEEVDRFILAVRQLPPNAWAHFHCRAGRGRTTTFMALYDMLRNADRVSLLDIVHRQSLLAGDYDLLGGVEEGGKKAVAADRAAFVRAFYDYARANPGGHAQLWTEWLAAQK